MIRYSLMLASILSFEWYSIPIRFIQFFWFYSMAVIGKWWGRWWYSIRYDSNDSDVVMIHYSIDAYSVLSVFVVILFNIHSLMIFPFWKRWWRELLFIVYWREVTWPAGFDMIQYCPYNYHSKLHYTTMMMPYSTIHSWPVVLFVLTYWWWWRRYIDFYSITDDDTILFGDDYGREGGSQYFVWRYYYWWWPTDVIDWHSVMIPDDYSLFVKRRESYSLFNYSIRWWWYSILFEWLMQIHSIIHYSIHSMMIDVFYQYWPWYCIDIRYSSVMHYSEEMIVKKFRWWPVIIRPMIPVLLILSLLSMIRYSDVFHYSMRRIIIQCVYWERANSIMWLLLQCIMTNEESWLFDWEKYNDDYSVFIIRYYSLLLTEMMTRVHWPKPVIFNLNDSKCVNDQRKW